MTERGRTSTKGILANLCLIDERDHQVAFFHDVPAVTNGWLALLSDDVSGSSRGIEPLIATKAELYIDNEIYRAEINPPLHTGPVPLTVAARATVFRKK